MADGGDVDAPDLPDGEAWQPLLDLAGRGGLMPALWSAARRLDLLQPVPHEFVDVLGHGSGRHKHVAAVLEHSHRENARRNVDLLEQLDAAGSLFAAAGIPVVALKGIGHVLRGVWPDPADRMMNDLDLLVPADRAAEAHARLQTAGYAVAPGPDRDADQHHLVSLRLEHRFGAIEVHREPLARGWTEALRAQEVIDAARPAPDRPSVLLPTVDHAAAIALVHAYLADGAWHDRVVPLRTVYELRRLDAREPVDWNAVRAHLARVRHRALVDQHLVSAWKILGAFAPATTPAVLRARARLALGDQPWLTPVDAVARALDAGRLRRHYGTAIGGPWRLRAHHLSRVVRRRS
jgi:hypothetical protein